MDSNPANAYSQHTMTRDLNSEVNSAGRLLLLSSISELGEHHY